MQKIRYRLVWNRKNRLNEQGEALVQIEARRENKKAYYSTGVYLQPGEWQNGEVVNRANSAELTAFIYSLMHDMEALELDAWKRGKEITFDGLRSAMKRKARPSVVFSKVAAEIVEASDRKANTKANLMSTVRMVEQWGAERGKRYLCEDITLRWCKSLERWLTARGQQQNTVAKHLRNIRTLVNEAMAQGHMTENPMREYKIRQEHKEHDYLRPHERKRLQNVTGCLNGRERHVCDAFLFCCDVGLRFSDFRAMDSSKVETDKNGRQWLRFCSVKTGARQLLPLSLMGDAVEIMNRYGSVEEFARLPDNATTNRLLKVVAKKAGITRRITFHLSRHTCATCMVSSGVTMTAIQKVLGHTQMRTTSLYAEVTADTLAKELRRARRVRRVDNG